MRDYRDAKAMAQSLRQALTHDNLPVTHSRSLELVAQAFGLENWNILAARIDAAHVETQRPAVAEIGPKTLHCSFCGKSQHDVKKLIAGPDVMICDACVALCNDVIEHIDVLALLPADGDDSTLAAYLSGRASEQLRAYMEKAKQAIDRDRASIGAAGAAIAARAGRRTIGAELSGRTIKFLEGKTDAELEAHKALLERGLARSERVPPIVARILAERDSA